MPLLRFKFGPDATPPLIQLNNHGILDLEDNIFFISEYDHNGVVRYTITPSFSLKCSSIVNSIPLVIRSLFLASISVVLKFVLITWSNLLLHAQIFNDLI